MPTIPRDPQSITAAWLSDVLQAEVRAAGHHAHWWESERLASLHWLKPYTTPPFPEVIIGNYRAGWPTCAERVDVANDRQLELPPTMLSGAATAIEDHDALALRPD